MVACNELVLKSQLLNQLSCVSVTENRDVGLIKARASGCRRAAADGAELEAEREGQA